MSCARGGGGGVVKGGREEAFVKCTKSCLYVCCKKENKKCY